MSQLTTAQGSKYTDETRREVLSHYVVLGNDSKVSELTGVPHNTIAHWRRTADWWEPELAKLQSEKSDEIDAGMSRIIDASIQAIENRIAHGDEVLHQGAIIKKAMTGKDLATVMGISFDKRQIMRNLPTSISAGIDNKALQDLKARFEALASRELKTIEGTADDISD